MVISGLQSTKKTGGKVLTKRVNGIPGFNVSSPRLRVEFLVNVCKNHQLMTRQKHISNSLDKIGYPGLDLVFQAT